MRFLGASWAVAQNIICEYAMQNGIETLKMHHAGLVPFAPKWKKTEKPTAWEISNYTKERPYSEYTYACKSGDVSRCPF